MLIEMASEPNKSNKCSLELVYKPNKTRSDHGTGERTKINKTNAHSNWRTNQKIKKNVSQIRTE